MSHPDRASHVPQGVIRRPGRVDSECPARAVRLLELGDGLTVRAVRVVRAYGEGGAVWTHGEGDAVRRELESIMGRVRWTLCGGYSSPLIRAE